LRRKCQHAGRSVVEHNENLIEYASTRRLIDAHRERAEAPRANERVGIDLSRDVTVETVGLAAEDDGLAHRHR
jgi:hypothetical protein